VQTSLIDDRLINPLHALIGRDVVLTRHVVTLIRGAPFLNSRGEVLTSVASLAERNDILTSREDVLTGGEDVVTASDDILTTSDAVLSQKKADDDYGNWRNSRLRIDVFGS
jgi:hypothetical protein